MSYFSNRTDLPILQIDDRRAEDREEPSRRQSPRNRTLLKGFMLSQDAPDAKLVTVRNLSDAGAKLELSPHEGVSRAGVLLIPTRQAAFNFEVIWKAIPFVGVRFISEVDLAVEKRIAAILKQLTP